MLHNDKFVLPFVLYLLTYLFSAVIGCTFTHDIIKVRRYLFNCLIVCRLQYARSATILSGKPQYHSTIFTVFIPSTYRTNSNSLTVPKADVYIELAKQT